MRARSRRRARLMQFTAGLFGAALLTATLGSCAMENADALASQGLEHAKRHELAEALEYFDAALRVDPANLKALYNGGLADLYLRKGASAAKRFEVFSQLRPEDPLGHFNLARAYAISLHREQAIASLHRSVELGFDRYDELMGGGFEAIEDDLRFAQIEVLVAQRAGVGVGFEGSNLLQGRSAYGGQRMKSTRLPGRSSRINQNCDGPTAAGAVAGMDADFASACQ